MKLSRPSRRGSMTQFPYCSITLPNLPMNGVIIVDKPAGWTSHDVVNRMRRILQQGSMDHVGTLRSSCHQHPPTGPPILFTKLAQFLHRFQKTYEGMMRFGFATNTYDADGEPLGEVFPASPSLERSPETPLPNSTASSSFAVTATLGSQENAECRTTTGAKEKTSHPATGSSQDSRIQHAPGRQRPLPHHVASGTV